MAGDGLTHSAVVAGSDGKIHHFSVHQLQTLRQLVREKLGIHISDEKDYLLSSKFSRMMASLGLEQVSDLMALLQHPTHDLELRLARFLTTNHTYFFREPDHFAVLVKQIQAYQREIPRIWCAASSTGEEVYSIVISLLEAGIQQFRLLASDINLEVLKACREGVYHPDRLHEVPKALLWKYFDRSGPLDNPVWRVKADLRQRVVLKRLNLVDPLVFEDQFQAIFCRNVMIYFDQATQKTVVANLLANLVPGGYLFVGHSEPLINIAEKVTAVASSVYKKPT